jgi:RNA 3'-terminal phosphate cyclase
MICYLFNLYLALADGESHIKVEKITDHCKTNIQVIEQILPIMFNIDEQKKEISVKGLGFRP